MTGWFWRALRRIGWALTVVFGVTTLSFFLVHVLPGDPARMIVGPQASARDVEKAREVYGLTGPLRVRYARYLLRLVHVGAALQKDALRPADHRSCASVERLHFDLGTSFHYRRPIVDLVAAKLPRSLDLALAALAVALAIGLSIGVSTAARPGGTWDEFGAGVALLGISAPTFITGLALQYVLAHRLGLLPYDGYGKTSAEHLASLVLPALTLGIHGSAIYARLVRAELGAALDQDFVRAARAKGASRMRALVVHGLRTALVPVATLAVLDLGALVGGAVVTEKLFRWPGMGQMAVEAIVNRDGPLVTATVLVAAIAIVAATLLVDLVAVFLDPRTSRA
ncbi:MAG: ABC transporter permease [Polyangiaceae bacterium]|nr:ABC transporter permease [Polyangiaceae bacterium]